MKNRTRILLCSDLDRTLLPNGPQPESPEARPLLRCLSDRRELELVYVTGRDRGLILEAIREYDLPLPGSVIGDVGSTLYQVAGYEGETRLTPSDEWKKAIAGDWKDMSSWDLAEVFADLEGIRLQEAEKQNEFKLSYYGEPGLDHKELVAGMKRRMEELGISSSLIWSIDEEKGLGLLDILPGSANKQRAVRFLMDQLNYDESDVVFAGDSGNDLHALTSGLQAVLVANASEFVRNSAQEALAAKGISEKLYLARGDFFGMNGNYSAGVLEGLAHFKPEVRRWIEEALASG